MILAGMATLNLTVQDASGSPVSGVKVAGMTSISGSSDMITGDDGKLSGYIPGGTSTVSISGYGDIEDVSVPITADTGSTISKIITITRRKFLKVTKSQNIKFSSNVQSIDFTIGGGGGSGSSTYSGQGGSSTEGGGGGAGGGGGYSVEKTSINPDPNAEYPVIIGAGGAKTGTITSGITQYLGNDGGVSSFMGVTANGGKHPTEGTYTAGNGYSPSRHVGGVGNGNGANTVNKGTTDAVMNNGSAGAQKIYTSFIEESLYGGGGGCGAPTYRYAGRYQGPGGTGGGPGGGDGGKNENQYTSSAVGRPGSDGVDGLGGGGGGGGCSIDNDKNWECGAGGKGGNGVLAIRMHLISE